MSTYNDEIRAAAEALASPAMKEVGWICEDGFPALIGDRPLKPGTKLYAAPGDWLEA